MKRYIYLGLGSVAMCIYGLMYNWTVFSPAVQADLGVSAASVSNVFSICQICFCLGGMVSGFIYYKVRFNFSMILSSLLILGGLWLASLSQQVILIYLGYSFIFSVSAGFAYKALLTAILTWFHDKPGLASGILVMGAGLTAFVFNVPTSLLIEKAGWRTAMLALAVLSFVISFAASLIIKPNRILSSAKKQNSNEEQDQVPTSQMLKSPKFYTYFVWSVLLLAGCSSISGTSVACGLSFGISATMAATLSMIISLFNSISRVFYGLVYDKIGRKAAMRIATTLFVIAVILLYSALLQSNTILLSCSFIFIGLSFGAVPTISSAYILTTFGDRYYPSNFSIQGTYTLFSSIFGSMLFSALYASSNSYQTAYLYLIVYALLALVLNFSLNHLLKKKTVSLSV